MKKLTILLSSALIAAALSAPAKAAQPVQVTSSGQPMFQDQGAYLEKNTTFIPLRALCEASGYQVSWNPARLQASVGGNGLSLSTAVGKPYLQVNGRAMLMPENAVMRAGSFYVPLRAVSEALGYQVGWEAATQTVTLDKTSAPLSGGSSYYKSDDLYWLSRIIHAESQGEPFEGKVAVGNVVLNRVKSSNFPNTVYGVIFDKSNGYTQFTPVANGAIHQEPNEESVIAAKICLEGYSVAPKALYFFNPAWSTSTWIAQNRPYAMTIGAHKFYN